MIYLDNAATTKISKEAYDAMTPYLLEEYGNPSGVYSLSRSAHSALDTARQQLAHALKARFPREIFFTSCGTESDNWALFGTALLSKKKLLLFRRLSIMRYLTLRFSLKIGIVLVMRL